MSDLRVGRRSVPVDVTSASWALDLTDSKARPIAIYCNQASTITASLLGDTNSSGAVEQTWILPIGLTWLAFKTINTSSTTKKDFRIIFGE